MPSVVWCHERVSRSHVRSTTLETDGQTRGRAGGRAGRGTDGRTDGARSTNQTLSCSQESCSWCQPSLHSKEAKGQRAGACGRTSERATRPLVVTSPQKTLECVSGATSERGFPASSPAHTLGTAPRSRVFWGCRPPPKLQLRGEGRGGEGQRLTESPPLPAEKSS